MILPDLPFEGRPGGGRDPLSLSDTAVGRPVVVGSARTRVEDGVGRGAAPSDPAYALASDLLDLLTSRSATLASCESLTGGLLGATLTSVAGASAVYRGGLITYATDLKHTLAGVDADELARDGAVAPSTALAMAAGARETCLADWGVGITGVAGPDLQEGHPAGTVFIAVADRSGAEVREYRFEGDRHTVRTRSVEEALRRLSEACRRA